MAAERCHCGHMRVKHYPDGGPCHICSGCWYWTPEGEEVPDARDQVGVDPTGPAATRVGGAAGPPDLDHAIHAAVEALRGAKVITSADWTRHLARVAVEAAAPVLLHATRDRLAWVAQLRKTAEAYIAEYDALEPYEWAEEFRIALDGPAAQEDGGQACDACGGLFTHDPQCSYLTEEPAAQEEDGGG